MPKVFPLYRSDIQRIFPATAPHLSLFSNGLTKFLSVSSVTIESLINITNIPPVPKLIPRYKA
ncbi:MAG: hypothetical protein ACI902_002416 [Psychroserpens sp.]|jgi:hypothetical protein